MSRKVVVEIQIRMVATIDDGVEVGQIVNELDYTILDTTTRATIEDTEIVGYKVQDSK